MPSKFRKDVAAIGTLEDHGPQWTPKRKDAAMKTTVELNRKHLEEIVKGLWHHIDRAKKKGTGIDPDDLRNEVSQLHWSLKFAVEQEKRNAK